MVSVVWIAKRSKLGTASYLNSRLYRWRKGLVEK